MVDESTHVYSHALWLHLYIFTVEMTVIQPFTTQSRLLTTLKNEPFENIVGKGENAGNLLYLHVFYLSQNKINLSVFQFELV